MQAIMTAALPVFALMGLGYVALRLRLVDETAVRGLNGFVFYFALPALLFVRVAEVPLDRLLDIRLLAAYYAASFTVFALAFFLGRTLFRTSVGEAAVQGFAAAYANAGYLGIPLVLSAFGPEALLPAVLAVTFDNVLLMPLVIGLIEADRGGGGHLRTLGRSFSGLIRNPLMAAIGAGFVLAALGVALPEPILAFGELLGGAAAPCALFALGGSLVGVPMRAARAEVGLLTALKLVLHPLLVWISAGWLFGLPKEVVVVATIVAALPTAASVFVVATRYQVYVQRSSTVILVGHVLAVVTVSALLALTG